MTLNLTRRAFLSGATSALAVAALGGLPFRALAFGGRSGDPPRPGVFGD